MTIDPLSHVVGFKSVISHRFKHIQTYSLCRTAAHGSTNSNGFLLISVVCFDSLHDVEIWWNMMKYTETCGGMQKLHHQAARLLPVSWLPLLVCYMYSLSNEQIQWFMLQGFQVRYGGYYTYSISISIFILHILYISHTHIYIYIHIYSMLREKRATCPGFGCEIQAFALRCLAWKDTFTASLGDGFAFSKRLMPFNWGIIYK